MSALTVLSLLGPSKTACKCPARLRCAKCQSWGSFMAGSCSMLHINARLCSAPADSSRAHSAGNAVYPEERERILGQKAKRTRRLAERAARRSKVEHPCLSPVCDAQHAVAAWVPHVSALMPSLQRLLCRSWRWHTRCRWLEPSSSWPLTACLGSTCRGLIGQRSQRRVEAQLDIICSGRSLAASLGSMHMYNS